MRTASVTVLAGGNQDGPAPSTVISTDRNWTVGRGPESNIVVADNRVSRQHLLVEYSGPAWTIRDVSTNGSWAAGVRVGPAGVAVPDVGEVRLRLGDSAGPEIVIAGNTDSPSPSGVVATGPPARSRRRRWIVFVVVALVLVLVAGDRVAAAAASTAAVQQVVQQGQGLGTKPTVSFGGIPFLTQVAFGDYRDIAVGIDDLTPSGGPRIKHLSAHLEGAHIPLSAALHNNVSRIPVDHVSATATLAFGDLNAFLNSQPGQLVLSAGSGGTVHVAGNLIEDGHQLKVAGQARLQAEDGQLTVTPVDLQVSGTGFDELISGLGGLAGLFPPIPLPLPDLPFNLRVTSVRASSDALLVSAAADHVVLDTGQ